MFYLGVKQKECVKLPTSHKDAAVSRNVSDSDKVIIRDHGATLPSHICPTR